MGCIESEGPTKNPFCNYRHTFSFSNFSSSVDQSHFQRKIRAHSTLAIAIIIVMQNECPSNWRSNSPHMRQLRPKKKPNEKKPAIRIEVASNETKKNVEATISFLRLPRSLSICARIRASKPFYFFFLLSRSARYFADGKLLWSKNFSPTYVGPRAFLLIGRRVCTTGDLVCARSLAIRWY